MLNEVYIQFTIESSTKTPIEITKYLDMEATKTWLKNDFKIKTGTIKYKKNGWQLSYKEEDVKHIDIVLKKIINILSSKKTKIKNLNASKKIRIIVYSKKLMPSFVYDINFIAFLHNTEIELEQDIYCLSST